MGDLGGSIERFNPNPVRIREIGDSSGRFDLTLTIPFFLDGNRVMGNETVSLAYMDWGIHGSHYVGQFASTAKTLFTTAIPPVSVFFANSQSTTLPEGSDEDHLVPIQLFVPYGDTITEDVTVSIVDLGTGSAESDVDYRGFATTQITFPAGSRGGDIRQFNVSILHDVQAESDESINLRLISIQGSAVLGDVISHQILISDDEISNSGKPNLFVSAENSQFNFHFSGPQVIEVVVIDADINNTEETNEEPDVTVNGKALRMVQAVRLI